MDSVRLIINEIDVYLYVNGQLISKDIAVKADWLLRKLSNENLIDPTLETVLLNKYGNRDNIPTIQQFVENEVKADMNFRFNFSVKYLYMIDSGLVPPQRFSELISYLERKYKRKPARIKEFLS